MRARHIKGSTKLLLVGLLAGSAVAVVGCGPEETEEVTGVVSALSASSAADRAAIALRWAPVHRQDTDQTGSQLDVPVTICHSYQR